MSEAIDALLDGLIEEYGVTPAAEPRNHRDRSGDLPPIDADLPKGLPGDLCRLVAEGDVEDRSGAFYRLVALAVEYGYPDDKVVAIARHHSPGRAKYGDQVDEEALRAIDKVAGRRGIRVAEGGLAATSWPGDRQPLDDIGTVKSNGHAALLNDLAGIQLPPDWWESRPALAHIRQAARCRLLAPDAVLGSVLVRIAAMTPHTVEIPAIVGSPLGLTFYVSLVGPPEAGKSAATAVAAELLPTSAGVIDGLPIGSGEGMVDVLFEIVEEVDDKGKVRKVKKQTRHAAIFHVDEGAVLTELAGRRGSTLLHSLRTAYTHGVLGNTNASVETRRILDGRSYVYGVALGIQPELAGPILADASAGTPQRFVWLSALDPAAPEEPLGWPGPLGWQPLDAPDLEPLTAMRDGWRRHPLLVDGRIAQEIRNERRGVMRGEVERAQLDAHRSLGRLKVAALLAVLDGRPDVGMDDWEMAGVVAATSRRVMARVEAAVDGLARRKEYAATERHTRREIHVEDTKAERALVSASRSVGNVVVRHARDGQHDDQDGGCTRNCFTRAIASKHRALVTVEEVVAAAERNGWLLASEGRWVPGASRPA